MGSRNLVSGSRSATGQVNSWPTSESLLHSRQCELPFEISIFYAYTWETCRRPASARTATQFHLAARHKYVRVCVRAMERTQPRVHSRRAASAGAPCAALPLERERERGLRSYLASFGPLGSRCDRALLSHGAAAGHLSGEELRVTG